MAGHVPPVSLGARPGQPTCKFCDAPLDPHQAARGGVCSAPRCEMKRVQVASRAVFQRNWDSYVGRQRRAIEAAGPQIAAAARHLDVPSDRIAVGVVPHQNRALTMLPDERRAEFAVYLDEIIEKAYDDGEPELDLTARETEEAREEPIIDATCATCQGKCCILGGPAHAFLTYRNVQQHRQRNPGMTGDAIKQYYLDRLPERSVEHSCVYHGPRGCVLSRQDRGDTCNRYHCNPQTQLLQKMREMKADHAVIIATEDDVGMNIATFETETGWRPVSRNADLEGFTDDKGDDAVVIQTAIDAAVSQLPPDLPAQGTSVAPEASSCEWCGQPIDGHKAMTTRSCGRADCEAKRIAKASDIVEKQKHDAYVARQEGVKQAFSAEIDAAAEASGVDRDALVIGVVPHQNAPIIPLPGDRRAAFEAHLDAIAAEGFAINDPSEYHNQANREIIDPPEEPLADAGCATCQGSCCTLGGESMAFLTKYAVCRYRLVEGNPTPEGFKAKYLAYLPDASARDGCFYQTEQGCSVPRTERADICNAFQCKGLKMLTKAFKDAPGDHAVIIAHKDSVPKALGLFDQDRGWRPMIRDGD